MPSKRKTKRRKTALKRVTARPRRLRAQGLRAVQHREPDLRNPKVLAELRREAVLLAQHPENDAIDAWIEAVYDWSEWR